MAALSLLALVAVTSASASPPPAAVSRWQPLMAKASRRFGVPIPWIARVIGAESGGQDAIDGLPIRSRAGAIGLMQLMPRTWTDMREAYRLGPNPDDPQDNIFAGAAYLRLMYDRFGYPGMFAAYNAGPARYILSLAAGRRLPAETRAYLAVVTDLPTTPRTRRTYTAPRSLFVVRHDQPEIDDQPADHAVTPLIFVVRSTTS